MRRRIRAVTLRPSSILRSNGGPTAFTFQTDDRSYRDIRLKTSGAADDLGPRTDNPNRTMLGTTQLQWLEDTLLQAQKDGTPWKFVAISSPIDQVGSPSATGLQPNG